MIGNATVRVFPRKVIFFFTLFITIIVRIVLTTDPFFFKYDNSLERKRDFQSGKYFNQRYNFPPAVK